MKKIILAAVAVSVLTGCAATTPRLGTIVINKFASDVYETNNPMQVKDDVVERLSRDLHKSILKHIKSDSKLEIVPDCSTGDFELTGKFEKVNVEIDSHYRFVTIKVSQEFKVDIVAELKSCKTGELLVALDPGADDEDMASLIDSLGEDIVGEISRVKVPKVKP